MDQTCPATQPHAELLARLADLLYVTGFDLSTANAYAERAIALSDELGLDRRATILRSRLAGYLSSNGLYGVMDIPRAIELFRQAERGLADEPESLAYGYWLGTLSTATGLWDARPAEALETAPGAIRIARRLGHESLKVLGEMVHGFVVVSTGAVDEGLALIEQAWESADRIDHRILGMRTVHIRSLWGLVLFEPAVVIRWVERELSRPRLTHVPIQSRTLQGSLAWAYALAGRLPDAERLRPEIGDLPVSMTYGPALELWQGDWPATEETLREGTRRCREMGDRLDEILLYGWIAAVCRLRGDLDGAEASLNDGLAIAVPESLGTYEAGFRVDLAILDVDRSRLESARRHLDRARELMAGQDFRGIADRFAMAEAALDAEEDPFRAGPRFERAVEALHARLLPWDEAEALLLWSRAAARSDPSLAEKKLAAANEIYRRCGAGTAWFERAEALTRAG